MTIAESATARASRPVVLVGFQEQANLGLGYLASSLRRHGYRVLVLDVEQSPRDILDVLARETPLLVGFSLVFQYYVRRFAALACYLREHGVREHFTVGGHFPSLDPAATFDEIPELDSIVRFEGEATTVDLADRLSAGREWRDVPGLAWHNGSDLVCNTLRPLVRDLDSLPYPDRPTALKTVLGQRMASLLASRGCARSCSFCSIHSFYRSAPGRIVRLRKPSEIVAEMRALHEERAASIFLFLDDDFPLFGRVWRSWAAEFVDELDRQGLLGRVLWKISARADSVDTTLFAMLRDAGLYLVYVGLESGAETGLQVLNKHVTVEQNRRAVATLQQLGIAFQFGFMMFEPSTTFETVTENVAFLREVCAPGTVAASFCRMLPYAGTPIRDTLANEGRLRGSVSSPDYDFTDSRIADLHSYLQAIVEGADWIFGNEPLVPRLNWAWNEVAVMERTCGDALEGMTGYRSELIQLTNASNELLLRVVEDCTVACQAGERPPWAIEELKCRCHVLAARMLTSRDAFVARNQAAILDAASRRATAHPSTPVARREHPGKAKASPYIHTHTHPSVGRPFRVAKPRAT